MSNFQGIPMPECTIQLWYNKQRIKKNGDVSLYLQVMVGGEHAEVKLKNIQWPAGKFDWTTKSLKPRQKDDHDLITYNAIIERERAKYWSVVMNFLKQDRPFDLGDIFKDVNMYKSGHLFCAFMEQAIKDRQKTKVRKDMIKESTAAVHLVSLGAFRDFLGSGDIEIARIDGDLLERFAEESRKCLVENTVWVRIQNIKSYLSYAFRNRIAVNPDYKRCIITIEETEPVWLEEHELNKLLQLYKNPDFPNALRHILRAFLFASFTGLRISDLSRWSKDWIDEGFISFVPVKKKKSSRSIKPVIIPILPIAQGFIDDLDTLTFQLPSDQEYNRGLKEVAEKAGIKKNITSHVARHTFATWLAIDGIPETTISKILGHKSTVTTRIYIHIAREYLAINLMKMQKRFGPGAVQPQNNS